MASNEPENKDFPGRSITPLFFNNFYLIVGEQTSRITLGETPFNDVPPNFSSTIVMPTEVAIELATKILSLASQQGILSPLQAIPTGGLSGAAIG